MNANNSVTFLNSNSSVFHTYIKNEFVLTLILLKTMTTIFSRISIEKDFRNTFTSPLTFYDLQNKFIYVIIVRRRHEMTFIILACEQILL